MKNLTPEEAGASAVALAIVKRILQQPAMGRVCDDMDSLENLEVFCGYLAREVDDELKKFGLSFRQVSHFDNNITLTPAERGKLDGILAKGE